jgi:hypothetical protein
MRRREGTGQKPALPFQPHAIGDEQDREIGGVFPGGHPRRLLL